MSESSSESTSESTSQQEGQTDLPKLPVTLDETTNEGAITPGTITTDDESPRPSITSSDNPTITGEHIFKKVKITTDVSERYEIGETLGSGGGGQVIEIIDRNLDRSIAVKFLPKSHTNNEKYIKKFIYEALITSRLDHPNILPIYDLEVSEGDQVYYSMKKVEGIPLTQFTNSSDSNQRDYANIISGQSPNIAEILNIFIKMSETIAHAHDCGIIHRDIKPDNVMLGAHGELRIVDWGIAVDTKAQVDQGGTMAGTPIYMSPEQAKRLSADKRSDIYCIGTTFFHVLFKRPIIAAPDADTFWELKKSGKIQAPSAKEQLNVPKPLTAICLKCIEADPEQRYQNATDLVNDLKSYLTGGLVNAYHYSLMDITKQWVKNNKSSLKWVALILIIITGTYLYILQQQQREYAGWGDPIYTESFDSGSQWKEDWLILGNSFTVKDNQLVSQNGPSCLAYYKYPIQGGVRIEFTGEMLEGFNAGDLSITYTPDLYDTNHSGKPLNSYFLQSGAQGNQCSTIVSPDGRVAYHRQTLETGKPHHIIGEIDGNRMRLIINGKEVCSHTLALPLNSGYIGIYGFYSGKAFDDIRVYNKELPELTTIIKTGDVLFENELYEKASARYSKLSKLYKNTDIGLEALFKYGLSQYMLGNSKQAQDIWSALSESPYKTEILYYSWDHLYNNGHFNELYLSMVNAFKHADNILLRDLKIKWSAFLKRAISKGKQERIAEFLEIRKRFFKDDQIFGYDTYFGMMLLGESDKFIQIMPDQTSFVARALIDMGRYDEVIEHYPRQAFLAADALLYNGQYEKILKLHPNNNGAVFSALLATGRYKEAADKFSQEPRKQAAILLAQNKYEEVIRQFPNTIWGEHEALFRSRRFKEFREKSDTIESDNFKKHFAIAYHKYLNEDKNSFPALCEIVENANAYTKTNINLLFQAHLLCPILSHLNGNRELLTKRAERIYTEKKRMLGMRLWHNVALLLGKISDKQFMDQPHKHLMAYDFHLFTAIREDLYGDKQAAIKHYHLINALPLYEQKKDPTLDMFVESRLQELEQ